MFNMGDILLITFIPGITCSTLDPCIPHGNIQQLSFEMSYVTTFVFHILDDVIMQLRSQTQSHSH